MVARYATPVDNSYGVFMWRVYAEFDDANDEMLLVQGSLIVAMPMEHSRRPTTVPTSHKILINDGTDSTAVGPDFDKPDGNTIIGEFQSSRLECSAKLCCSLSIEGGD